MKTYRVTPQKGVSLFIVLREFPFGVFDADTNSVLVRLQRDSFLAYKDSIHFTLVEVQ